MMRNVWLGVGAEDYLPKSKYLGLGDEDQFMRDWTWTWR